MEIWFGIINWQILSIFDSYLLAVHRYFHSQMITLVNISGFSPSLVCVLILSRPGFGLLMGEFLTELSARDMCLFSFLKDNFSNYQWIFTKLGALILWRSALGLLMGKFSSIFDVVICLQYIRILLSGQ